MFMSRAAHFDLATAPVELGPGRQAFDIKVGAEAQGVDGPAHDALMRIWGW